jgi:hypothetical protein
MRFLIFVALLFVFFTDDTNAQLINTTYEDALSIKKRILLVALPEEDKSLVAEKLDQLQFIKQYREDLDGQRKAFQSMVMKYWTFTDSIIVLPFKEAKSLMKKNPEKYAMLRYADKTQDQIYIRTHDSIPVISWALDKNNYYYNIFSRYDFRMLTVNALVIELPKRVLEVSLPKLSLSEGDFIYAIRQMEYILKNIMTVEGRNAKILYKEIPLLNDKLKNKILLLDVQEMDAKEGLRDIQMIKKYYSYPVQLVNYKELEDILRSGDTRYVVAVHSRYDFHNSTCYVCNAGDGTIYSQFNVPTFDYGTINQTQYTIQIYYPGINKLHLESYMGKLQK